MQGYGSSAMLAAALGVALAAAATPARAAEFTEDFDDGLGAASFTTNSSSTAVFDYGYNYSTYTYYKAPFPGGPFGPAGTIPSAPRSTGGSTVGLRMSARQTTANPIGWVSAFANYDANGPFRMTFDMWVNYNGGPTGGDGSTEFTFWGLSNNGTGMLKTIGAFGSNGEGYGFTTTGEGGSGTDYRIYYTDPTDDGPAYDKINATWEAPGPYPPNPDNNTNDFYDGPTGVFAGTESPGAPGKSWVTVTLEQYDATHVSYSFNGIKIATLTLQPEDAAGKPFLAYGDTIAGFPGVQSGTQPAGDSLADEFVLFDNVVIEVIPEPGSLALLGLAGMRVLRRRRA